MATTTHRRISRKELKRPDEFVTFFDAAGDFLQENLSRVIVGAVVVVALLGLLVGLNFYSQHQARLAAETFYQASYALEHKNYHAAEHGFRDLADTRSGNLGSLARFYLANTYLAQKQSAKARDALEAYLKSAHQERFKQLALTQLGVVDEDLGNYAGAREAYVQAAVLDGPEKERALLGAARMLAHQGDKQGAIAAYQRFLRENPFATNRRSAVEALAQLGIASVQPQATPRTIEIPPVKPTR